MDEIDKAAYEPVEIEQSESGLWAWTCPGCWRGIGLVDRGAAQREFEQHVERGHDDPYKGRRSL